MGEILSNKTNLSPPAGRGLIKLALKDQLGPFRPLEDVNYDEFMKIISISLKARLIKMEVEGWESIIDILLSELNNYQSLLTMSKV